MKFNLPNILTLLRILLIPVLVVVFYLPYDWMYPLSAGIYFLAGATDWLDGYYARKLGETSAFGAFLDPVADKTKTKVTITSTPSGARVLVDNIDRGKSPVTIEAVKGSIIHIKLLLPWHKDFHAEEVLSNKETQMLHYKLK